VNAKRNKLKIFNIQNYTKIRPNETTLDLAHHSIKYIKLVNYEMNERLLLVFLDSMDYIQVWHMKNMTLKCGIKARITSTRAVEIFQNRILIIGTVKETEKKVFYIEMWFLETCELISRRVSAHMIASLRLINYSTLASGHYFSNRILIWSLFESLIAIKQLEADTKRIVYLESNKKLLVSANLNGTLHMWNTTNWSLIASSPASNSTHFIIYMKLLSTNSVLTVDSMGNISVISYKNSSSFTLVPTTIKSLNMKVIQVEQLDNDRFLMASLDGLVTIWSLKTNAIDAQFLSNTSIYSFVFVANSDYRNFLLISIVFVLIMIIFFCFLNTAPPFIGNKSHELLFNSLMRLLNKEKERERNNIVRVETLILIFSL
jgi:hypothetical protein